MRAVLFLVFAHFPLIATAQSEPISMCRETHKSDKAAHIQCLEDALRRQQTSASVSASTLGDEQVRANERRATDEREVSRVTIVSSDYNAQGLGVFRMEDGQLWRETESTPERKRLKPNTQYTARIERGTLGGYRLYVDGIRRMHKVERVK